MPIHAQTRSNHFAEPSIPTAPTWLSIAGAAIYTGLCEKTIRRLIESEKIVARRPVRGRVLIHRGELDTYILGCTQR